MNSVLRSLPLLIAVLQTMACADNLIQNGDFREVHGGLPSMWATEIYGDDRSGVRFSTDTVGAFEGCCCARIENIRENDAKFVQHVQVKPSTLYRLSCRIKAQGTGPDKKGASITVMDILETSRDVKESSGRWEYVELCGRTGSAQQQALVTLRLGFYGSVNTGVAWFDDVRMEEISVLPPGARAVDLYRGGPGGTATGETGDTRRGMSAPIAGLILFTALVAAFFILRKRLISLHADAAPALQSGTMTRRDIAIVTAIAMVYGIFAFVNLGSFKNPQTFWKPANRGESIVVDFGAQKNLRCLKSYLGLGKGTFQIGFSDDGIVWRDGVQVSNPSIFEPMAWRITMLNEHARYATIFTELPGAMLGELAFFENPAGAAATTTIIKSSSGRLAAGKPEYVFDEPRTVPSDPGFFNSMYFDEQYHARTAFEYLQGVEPTETTHPPLGKAIIAMGIAVFGMTPFGWRFSGVMLGILMLPIIYLFAKRVFRRTDVAFFACVLFAFDFMHFVQTRIATIDVHGVFFIMLMFLFMERYFSRDFSRASTRELLTPLLLSGVCFGLGAACKWIAVYGGAGLAVIFMWSIVSAYRSYLAALARTRTAKKNPLPKQQREADKKYVEAFPKRLGLVVCWSILSFVIIPAAIYTLSYAPIMALGGSEHGLSYAINNQKSMFDYHSMLKSTHPFSSAWWEWPVMLKPVWYFQGLYVPQGKVSSIVAMGNPAVWWPGIMCMVAAIALAIRKRDRAMAVVLIAMASQYLPWIVSPRKLVFIYHFFATVPFMVLCIAYVYASIPTSFSRIGRWCMYAYTAIVIALFAAFYPVLSGMLVDKEYVLQWLRWLKTWYFVA